MPFVEWFLPARMKRALYAKFQPGVHPATLRPAPVRVHFAGGKRGNRVPYVPEWAPDMRLNLTNQVHCAHALTDCLEMFGHMLAVERGGPVPGNDVITDLHGRILAADGEWMEYDRQRYELLCGHNRLEMFEEMRAMLSAAR